VEVAADGDPDPISAGTAGEAARWGGSSAAVGMTANPFGAHRVGVHKPIAWPGDPRLAVMLWGVSAIKQEPTLLPTRPLFEEHAWPYIP